MTSGRTDNLFENIPATGNAAPEEFSALLTRPGVKIERIVSQGHASPPGFWYDQAWDEWVIVLSGAAKLRFEDEPDARVLGPGDHLFIPARRRHRVDWTSATRPTVWLAVHIGKDST